MLKLKTTAKELLSKDNLTDLQIKHQSLPISKHSLIRDAVNFTKELRMSLQPGFLASHFLSPENKPEQMTHATCGLQTIECIRQIRPKYAFLENVPGLLSSGYFGTIIGALHEARYNAKWCSIGAADVGAAHRRKRIWILANDISKRGEGLVESKNIGKTRQGRWFSKEDLQQIADNPFERTDMWPKPLLRGKKWMGWPIGWTDLEPLAMDKFQSWPQQHINF